MGSLEPSMTAAHHDANHTRKSLLGPILVGGFQAAIAMWCVWFVGHLPAIDLPSAVNGPLIVLTLAASFFWTGRQFGRAGFSAGRSAALGLAGGLLCAVVNLLLLGSKIVEQPAQAALEGGAPTLPAAGPDAFKPAAGLIVSGWLAMSGLVGALAAGLGSRIARRAHSPDDALTWTARLGVIAAVAIAPLLLIGGLVTSTRSGMAVPDWPNSYGANMFLYPISLMSHPKIFLEHSHRLFGALIGLTTMAMMIATLLTRGAPRLSKILAVVVFVLVCVQGLLGGLRVTENSQVLALGHGVLAQITFACAAWLMATLLPGVRAAAPRADIDRLYRVFSTGTVHAYILQLALGAAYRHMGQMHALWSHIAFSFVVLLLAIFAGAMAQRATGDGAAERLARRVGLVLIAVVSVQFLLGWAAFVMMTHTGDRPLIPQAEQIAEAAPVPMAQALVRTLHQANGAIMLATATVGSVLAQRLVMKKSR